MPFDTPVVKSGTHITRINDDDISARRVTGDNSDWRVTNADIEYYIYNSYSHQDIGIRQKLEESCNAEESEEYCHYKETYYYNKERTSAKEEKQNKKKK